MKTMKNNIFKRLTKLERIRKLCYATLRWFFILLISLQCVQLSAQVPLINITMKNVSLHEILMEIKKQSGKGLIYNNNLIDIFNNETIDLKNAKTEDVLKKILEGKNLDYKIVDDVIIIEPDMKKQNPDYIKQTTITGLVTDSLNNPVPFASVYLSKTTEGTYTDKNGVYSLSIPREGLYELIISCIGYKLNSRIINAEGKTQKINIKLSRKIFELNEVTIEANDRNRRRYYSQFEKYFIGETINSLSCKIINPEDLHLYRDTENNILKGYSLNPLIIENKALGYKIIYDLTDFSYDFKTDLVRFSGYNHFQQLAGTEKRKRIREKNRLVAYYGSKMHFMRALFSDSLSTESFKIYDCKYDSVTMLWVIKPVLPDIIRSYNKDNSVNLLYTGTLLVRYSDNHPELAPEIQATSSGIMVRNDGGIYGGTDIAIPVGIPKQTHNPENTEPNEYNSFIYFSDTLKVYQNGSYYKPYSITLKGDMANPRIADMLPDDYFPYKNVNNNESRVTSSENLPVLDSIKTGSSKPAEKVYLHIDRATYNSGDDILFKAYLIDALTNIPASGLTNLHVELIDPDLKIIQSRIVRILDGIGNGDFHLTDSAYSGRYRIRAYTNQMRNFKGPLFFEKEILIINPLDEGKDLSKEIFYVENKPEISFFPEGGSLVDNVQSVVAFKSVDAAGKGYDIAGELYSSSGETITTFKSTHLGMGFFTFTPVTGISYYTIVKSKNGSTVKTELPESFPAGMTLSVFITLDKKLLLTVRSNEKTLPSLINKEFLLTFSSRNLFSLTTKIKINSIINNFILPPDELPEGIIRVTLADVDGPPLCERLVFLQKKNDVFLHVATVKKEYIPREKVTAVISLSGDTASVAGASLSLSAAEIQFTDSTLYSTNIVSWFFLESDVRGFVEEPSCYFDPTNRNRFPDLDLLLMTQGWRDFQWKYDSVTPFIDESGFTISGRIKAAFGQKPLEGAKLNIGLFGNSANHFMNSVTDSMGIFKVVKVDFTGRNNLFISATGNNGKVAGKIFLDSLVHQSPDITRSDPAYQINYIKTETYSRFLQEASYNLEARKKYKLSDTIKVGEVTITATKIDPPEMIKVKESRRVYGTPDKEVIVTPAMENYVGDVFSFMSGRIPGARVVRSDNVAHAAQSYVSLRGQGPALILLDGMRIDSTSMSSVLTLQVNMIDRIDVLNASPLYGMSGANGVINIITRVGLRRNPEVLGPNSASVIIKGFDAPRIFYSPKYDVENKSAFIPDTRSTILWEPNIEVDNNRESSVQFFNADKPAKISIVVEGITREGIPVTGRTSYEVK
jgi:hypothetical protein